MQREVCILRIDWSTIRTPHDRIFGVYIGIGECFYKHNVLSVPHVELERERERERAKEIERFEIDTQV